MANQSTPKTTRATPWPVARLSGEMHAYIERVNPVWAEGELTNWKVTNHNAYATLKDLNEDASISLKVWRNVLSRLEGEFAAGDHVLVQLKADYWVRRGELSYVVQDISHVGIGALLERLEALRKKLQGEGLFETGRKQALPFLPGVIGLITGKNSDAEKDVLKNATLRWPGVQFRTIHTAVQGERAAAEVTGAIAALDADPEVEVIIIARGGGDFEHLLPFSDETLVRAAASATTPIVSAIGHEADRPLLDEVADLRASTPTDAAKRVVPDVVEQLAGVDQARARMSRSIGQRLQQETERVSQLRSRPVLARPERIVDERTEDLVRLLARGADLADRAIDDRATRLESLRGRITALSPRATLERGYAIAQRADGKVIMEPGDAPAGTALSLALAGGRLDATAGEASVS